jgi:hypothetical protein
MVKEKPKNRRNENRLPPIPRPGPGLAGEWRPPSPPDRTPPPRGTTIRRGYRHPCCSGSCATWTAGGRRPWSALPTQPATPPGLTRTTSTVGHIDHDPAPTYHADGAPFQGVLSDSAHGGRETWARGASVTHRPQAVRRRPGAPPSIPARTLPGPAGGDAARPCSNRLVRAWLGRSGRDRPAGHAPASGDTPSAGGAHWYPHGRDRDCPGILTESDHRDGLEAA